ncbi:AAA family ATPase [Halobacillus seohaensis]|uniref:ATP-dependent endonuclease n=1 Tax=Halobacillus seohaensis TaxID=447421 RepID=A0ABW2EIJ5_9BACI
MYLSDIKIWNFRKFGEVEKDGETYPGLSLSLNKGLNLLVGENDSGKTAIVDALRYTILTQSYEYIRLEHDDFHLPEGESESGRSTNIRIECIFRGFKDNEAKNFLEWLGIEKGKDDFQYYLRVFLVAKRKEGNIYYDIKAGADEEGMQLNGEVRNLLRTTYLKPLRDAERELAPRRNSRLSQILDNHEAFKDKNEDHYLFEVISEANNKIKNYFKGKDGNGEELDDPNGKKLLEEVNFYLEKFSVMNNELNSDFKIAQLNLKNILEKLSLSLRSEKTGLGSHNLLFIATELLLLKREEYTGVRLALIEEIEAHLHTQAQLRLIDFLQEEASKSGIQLILTTHSPILASKINLKNLILCNTNNAFPMGPEHTELESGDYLFLERFLDSTKANLFFAQGVILVEGDAENLLIPVLAEIIDRPLSQHGVSMVNVGNTAFLRYSRIFKRRYIDKGILDIKVACITDNDIKPDLYKKEDEKVKTKSDIEKDQPIEELREHRKSRLEGQNVKVFISPDWTLEFDIALSDLQRELFTAVLHAEKIQNSDKIGLTEKKREEVDKKIDAQYKEWEELDVPNLARAFYIYKTLMLDKKISKAITAQCLGNILNKRKSHFKPKVLQDEKLNYLVQAIQYTTDQVATV